MTENTSEYDYESFVSHVEMLCDHEIYNSRILFH